MAERTARLIVRDEHKPMRGASAQYVVADDAAFLTTPTGRESWVQAAFTDDEQCTKCGAEMDDGECEECERVAPLDFDQ